MAFLYPSFLYALAALAIPIIVHLFNFRRFKKIPFTNVKFLREIKHQTQSQNRLKHLLILLTRLLAIAFLVLAFAQPYIPENDAANAEIGKTVSIFLDNSFSMEGESESGEMLEVARNRAIDIAQAYASTDRFQLLTQDFEGKHQRLIGQREFIDLVQEVEISPQSRPLNEIAERQNDLLKRDASGNQPNSYIISDFQKSKYNISEWRPDTAINVSLVALERNSPANLYIDSVWFGTPVRKIGESEQLMVRIANNSQEDVADVPLKLDINGVQKAIGSFGAAAGAAADTALYFVSDRPGIMRAKIHIEDFPVTYDDDYYLSYTVYEEIDVLAIKESVGTPDNYIGAVFKGDSTFNYQTVAVNNVDYANLKLKDFIILYELVDIPSGLASELLAFAKNGGSVWLIPSVDANTGTYNDFLSQMDAGAILSLASGDFSVRKLNTDHPLYRGLFEKLPKNIDLPNATQYFEYSRPLRSTADDLMTLGSGNSFLTSYNPGQGHFYSLAVPLSGNASNFTRHALFVASALRMAEMSQATAVNSIEVGQYFTMPSMPLGNESVFHLLASDGSADVIPQYQQREGRLEISPGPDVKTAGNYNVLMGTDTISAAGINYSRSESDLESFAKSNLKELLSSIPGNSVKVYDGNSSQMGREIALASTGTQLWKICLILVLAFLLIETLLLRFWKKQLI